MILSTVRSLPKSEVENHPTNGWCRRKLGFITDEHQINVAITRARKGLIFIGKFLRAGKGFIFIGKCLRAGKGLRRTIQFMAENSLRVANLKS